MVRSFLRNKADEFSKGYREFKQNMVPAMNVLGTIPAVRNAFEKYGGKKIAAVAQVVDKGAGLASKYARGKVRQDDIEDVLESGFGAYKKMRMA